MLSDSLLHFSTLIDSGSTHCFVDSKFVQLHNLPAHSIHPIELKLFDGTSNSVITVCVNFPVLFPTNESMTIELYVTPLDSSCSVVLGYNWLTCYNPLIDWVLGSITFHPQIIDLSILSLMSSAQTALLPQQNPIVPDSTPKPLDSALHISLIGAAAFMCACKLPGSQCYRTQLSNTSISANSASSSNKAPDLSQVPKEYHDYADVFSKAKAYTLASHWPYDLKIDLDEGTSPPILLMYPLSQVELQTLCNFLDEHLNSGFIRSSMSLHGASVPFVRKKDGLLRLCINFCGLNWISKRINIHYHSLSTAGKAHIYTTIELRHAYHLVCIVEGDKSKTVFCTHYSSFEWLVMPFRHWPTFLLLSKGLWMTSLVTYWTSTWSFT